MSTLAAKAVGLLTTIYMLVVLVAAGYAMYIDLTMLNSEQEHLAPDILLFVLTLPLSSLAMLLSAALPVPLDGPFVRVTLLAVCGASQAWLVFAAMRGVLKKAHTKSSQ